MAVDIQDVRAVLEPEEPDYAAAAALGPEALRHLQALVDGEDPMLASKAAYAASLLEGSLGEEVIRAAVQHSDPIVRVAAAAAARNLPVTEASTVLLALVGDDDPGVRKVARSSASDDVLQILSERLDAAPDDEPDQPSGGLLGLTDLSMLDNPMPGEGDPSALMHGAASRLPGEQATGLMPGETPGSGQNGTSGRMPGEAG